MAGQACFVLPDGTRVEPSVPFFIAGSGRCGTTLMRRLIVERTQAVVPPENYALAASTRILAKGGSDWPLFCRTILEELARDADSWPYFHIAIPDDLALLTSIPAAFRSMANFWHAFHALYAVRIGKPGTAPWGDKTPSNAAKLPDILRIFPRAKFVLMVRDVFDMAFSYGSMPTALRAGQYLEGADRWVDANLEILAFADQHAAQTMIVRYEDLVQCPEQQMAGVLRLLGLPIATSVPLNPLETQDIASHSHLGNVLDAVSGDRIGQGRAALTQDVKDRIEAIAAVLQIRLGYEPTGTHPLPFVRPSC